MLRLFVCQYQNRMRFLVFVSPLDHQLAHFLEG